MLSLPTQLNITVRGTLFVIAFLFLLLSLKLSLGLGGLICRHFLVIYCTSRVLGTN